MLLGEAEEMMSEPVEPCPSCPEGWRPIHKQHCAKCHEGQIERLRNALKEISSLGRLAYADGSPSIRMGKIAEDALTASALWQGE
jgi:hypothetical protein